MDFVPGESNRDTKPLRTRYLDLRISDEIGRTVGEYISRFFIQSIERFRREEQLVDFLLVRHP
ncbi:hypothetical protein D3C77_581210 [compost metagenome]